MYLIQLVYSKQVLIALSPFFAIMALMDTAILNSGLPLWVLVVATLWSLPWKGVALWHAARLSHKRWFIVLLLLNTLAILDIIYIYFIARRYTIETIESK